VAFKTFNDDDELMMMMMITPRLGKLWPASRLRPVDAFEPARNVFLS